jgi:hypothetical protein
MNNIPFEFIHANCARIRPTLSVVLETTTWYILRLRTQKKDVSNGGNIMNRQRRTTDNLQRGGCMWG